MKQDIVYENLNVEETTSMIQVLQTKNKKHYKQNFLTKRENLRIIFLLLLSAFIFFSINFIFITTGNVTLEQLAFHLKVPLEGTNEGIIVDYLFWTFVRVIISIAVAAIIIFLFEAKSKFSKNVKKKILYLCSNIALIACLIYIILKMDVYGFVANQIQASNFIEEEYVEPSNVNIIFPEQKQNLIYIYLESIENTFSSKDNGGMYEEDRMPELTKLAKENLTFSNTESLGGAYNLIGSNWTVASMVSQTAGIPLKISIDGNSYGKYSTFLPGAYSLGEVLEKNGYTNYLLIGSESTFGGRDLYFTQHGNYKIWDYNSAIKEGRMTKEDKVWWGYSDSDLFKYAKEQLTEISKKEESFNYTMLTVDTHFTDGYICNKCENQFEDQYSNVIRCSSKQVSEFVEWIKNQPFFKNTTIILAGDHITMQNSTAELAKENGYGERATYNVIINSRASTENVINRQFLAIDMYPTTLAAIGAEIEGNKLGLGTNLFSDEKTIVEKFGLQYVREELGKKSKFYNESFIY